MRNISDIIENHLKSILTQSDRDLIEIKRSELAQRFQCVPSQINYVIRTRFTVEKGYIVESKRGGGGYIRISKVKPADQADLCQQLMSTVGKQIDQQTAESVIVRLLEEDAITNREAKLLLAVIERNVITLAEPQSRDYIRANIMQSVLQRLRYEHA
ncbi:CtsR family transcriptional regulator [Salsuginibacillus kocurii]|uniref:CtsR family transcriptional regulator n=1 Tax=Salsuginibacillus kocurii TaxID=427078 RepID=UPI00036CA758|nr:CtsR family transcriptional regulator [Salsuginibacillus kocurii]